MPVKPQGNTLFGLCATDTMQGEGMCTMPHNPCGESARRFTQLQMSSEMHGMALARQLGSFNAQSAGLAIAIPCPDAACEVIDRSSRA